MPERAETIRSLERGITVLRYVSQRSASSLADIHRATGLAKPTLLRILNTLEGADMIWRGLADGLYRVTIDPTAVLPREALPGEEVDLRVQSLHRELTKATGWPSDYAVCDGYWMIPRLTTRASTPKVEFRDVLRRRIAIVPSALGRVYLAFCSAPERERILQNLRGRADPENRGVGDETWIRAVLDDVRKKGYGVREPGYGDHSAAIAVPVMSGHKVLACVNLVWRPVEISQDEFVRRNLGPLRETARGIARLLLEAAADGGPAAG